MDGDIPTLVPDCREIPLDAVPATALDGVLRRLMPGAAAVPAASFNSAI